VIEHPPGSGIYCAQYFCQGCPRHAPGTPRARRRHRERAGTIKLAGELYRKRKTEIREGRFFPKAQTAAPWDPVFAAWRDEKLTGYVADYLARKGSTLVDLAGAERFARYFAEAPETKGKMMRTLTTQDFERYRERRRQGGAVGVKRQRGAGSVSTLNKELSFARAVLYDFIEALEDRKEPPIPNPVRTRLFTTEPAGRTRYLTDDEETRLCAALPAADWPKVLVALHTGLDRGEQFGLKWAAQVDFTTRTIHAERRKGRREGPVPVTIPINDDLLATLRALPSRGRSDWVFPNADSTGPLDGRAFDRLLFRPALKRAGITGFRWKDLRHTFATRLRMSGSDTGTIRDLLGHTTDRMTKRYAHAAPSHLHAAVQRINRDAARSATTSATSADAESGARAADRASTRVGGQNAASPAGFEPTLPA